MANLDIRKGLVPVRHVNGNPYNGKFRVYYVPVTDGTALFIGDPVLWAGSADTLGKYATIAQATTGSEILGAIVAMGNTPTLMADTSDLTRVYRPSSTALYIGVADDPDLIFEAQGDDDSENIVADDVGSTLDIIFTHAGNTATGMSGCELDSSTGGQTNDSCRLLGLVDREDNVLGEFAKFEVLIVKHAMSSLTGV